MNEVSTEISTDARIEAVLFYLAEPVSTERLGKMLEIQVDEIKSALNILRERLSGRGLTLIQHEGEIELATSALASSTIESIRKDELDRDLGKAGAETLAIVLYRGPVSRAHIEYVRGVNSSFILRQLMIRGLIEREHNPDDARSYRFKPTIDVLRHLGITSIDALPDYDKIRSELLAFESGQDSEEPITTNA